MKYELVIWDFDGTLADTVYQGVQVYNTLAEQYGFEPLVETEQARDMTLRQFLAVHRIPIFRTPRLMKEFLGQLRGVMANVQLYPNLNQTLETLREAGCRLGIVSSNAEENIRSCLAANHAEELFEFVIGYKRLFGKERAIRRALSRARCPVGSALYIRDEVRDLEAAGKVGIDIAAVGWGLNSEKVLREHRPTYFVESVDQLHDVVQNSPERSSR